MKRKTFDNYDYEEAFPVELDRDIQKKARKNFEKEHPLQVPDYEEQWKEQQEKLKEWELERLLKEGKVESLYRTTTTKAKNLQSGSELLEAQIYPSFCHKADVPHTKKGRESKPSQKNLNDKNSRRYFIRLANINFGENDLWCTFTWDKEHIPADEAAALLPVPALLHSPGSARSGLALPSNADGKIPSHAVYSLQLLFRFHALQ